MAFCENCGNQLSESDNFCKSCGLQVKKTHFNQRVQHNIAERDSSPVSYRTNINEDSVHQKKVLGRTNYLLWIIVIAVLCGVIYFGYEQREKKLNKEWREYRNNLEDSGKPYLNFEDWKKNR